MVRATTIPTLPASLTTSIPSSLYLSPAFGLLLGMPLAHSVLLARSSHVLTRLLERLSYRMLRGEHLLDSPQADAGAADAARAREAAVRLGALLYEWRDVCVLGPAEARVAAAGPTHSP